MAGVKALYAGMRRGVGMSGGMETAQDELNLLDTAQCELYSAADQAAYQALLYNLPVLDMRILEGLDLNLPELNLEIPELDLMIPDLTLIELPELVL